MTRLELTFKIEMEDFDEEWLRSALVGFLGIQPNAVRIVSTETGSVRVTIELPTESAEKLLNAYVTNEPDLARHLDPLILADLRREVAQCERMPSEAPTLDLPLLCARARNLREIERWKDLVVICEDILRIAPTHSDAQTWLAQASRELARIRVLTSARPVIERFFVDEARFFDLISERFFAEVERLRAQRPFPRHPGLLGRLLPWRRMSDFAMPLRELGVPLSVTMTPKVLSAAIRMEEVLLSHRVALAAGSTVPESIRRELLDIGLQADLPYEVVEELVATLVMVPFSSH